MTQLSAMVAPLCGALTLVGSLALAQGAPQDDKASAGATFVDKPEYLVLPRPGAAGAVECAVYPPRLAERGAKAGVVVHLYGRGGSCRDYNMMRPSYATVRRLLWERGYWLIVPDLGTDHWMNDAACASLDAVIEGMVRDHGADPARISLLGSSMGAGSGLVYVMRRPGRIRAVCATFPMTDFAVWVQELPGYLSGIAQAHGCQPSAAAAVLQDLSPLQHAALFASIPVFLLHGDADSKVPVHHSRDFAAALQKQGSPVTYREARGVEHDDAIAEPFQQELADFLTK